MKFLAPAGRGDAPPIAREGEQVLPRIGCASCHTPRLMTGPSREPLFDRKPVPLFSDLLLHDVGTGDDIPQAAALPEEIRTPALWGLRFRRPLLHDGSAPTIEEAILRHGKKRRAVRQRFRSLPTRRALRCWRSCDRSSDCRRVSGWLTPRLTSSFDAARMPIVMR